MGQNNNQTDVFFLPLWVQILVVVENSSTYTNLLHLSHSLAEYHACMSAWELIQVG